MKVELGKLDLVRLICGIQPDYSQMDDTFGQYWDIQGKWEWNTSALDKFSEEQLWDYYQKLIAPRPKYSNPVEEQRNSDILEMQAILEDGIMRGNSGQVQAAKDELKRLEELYK